MPTTRKKFPEISREFASKLLAYNTNVVPGIHQRTSKEGVCYPSPRALFLERYRGNLILDYAMRSGIVTAVSLGLHKSFRAGSYR